MQHLQEQTKFDVEDSEINAREHFVTQLRKVSNFIKLQKIKII